MDRHRISVRSLLFLLILIGGVLYQGYVLLPGIRQELLEVRGIALRGMGREVSFRSKVIHELLDQAGLLTHTTITFGEAERVIGAARHLRV